MATIKSFTNIKTVLEKILSPEGATAMLQIDTSAPDLKVPERFYKDELLPLRISYYFQDGMTLTDDKVLAKLTFGDETFLCEVPYKGILTILDEQTREVYLFQGGELVTKAKVEEDASSREEKIPERETSESPASTDGEHKRPFLRRIK